jgi:hypothetical protein
VTLYRLVTMTIVLQTGGRSTAWNKRRTAALGRFRPVAVVARFPSRQPAMLGRPDRFGQEQSFNVPNLTFVGFRGNSKGSMFKIRCSGRAAGCWGQAWDCTCQHWGIPDQRLTGSRWRNVRVVYLRWWGGIDRSRFLSAASRRAHR